MQSNVLQIMLWLYLFHGKDKILKVVNVSKFDIETENVATTDV